VGVQVHVGEVAPDEERRVRVVLSPDVLDGGIGDVVVDGLHPLGRQWPGVLDRLLADGPKSLLIGFGRILDERRALQHTAGQRHLVQPGELVLVRVVELFGFLLSIQVIRVAGVTPRPMPAL
jgi:hypothetical protein